MRVAFMTPILCALGSILVACAPDSVGTQQAALSETSSSWTYRTGQALGAGDYLSAGEYLVSEGGLFFLVLQHDCNLVLYHGASPSQNLGAVWATDTVGEGTVCFAIMQEDGNFAVYLGSGPDDNRGSVYASKTKGDGAGFLHLEADGTLALHKGSDPSANGGIVKTLSAPPAVKSVRFQDVVYHEDQMEVGPPVDTESQHELHTNETDIQELVVVTHKVSWSETTSWQFSVGAKLSATVEITTKVPGFGEEKVSYSAEASFSHQWGGSTTNSMADELKWEVPIPPHSEVDAYVVVTQTEMTLPYTATGVVTYEDGTIVHGTFDGTFIGDRAREIQTKAVQTNL